MQPYLFPYIGYFQLLNLADKFILLNDVNFIKKGWINRNYILVNRKRNLFTIPVTGSSQNKLIKDIEISFDKSKRDKFLLTIEKSYKKAPFFGKVYGLIDDIISVKTDMLNELILHSITEINKYLEITTEISESSGSYPESVLKGEDRIIEICQIENAAQYINLSGGMNLYSKEKFRSGGIELNFLKTKKIVYRQFENTDFEESLSVIDILMFNPKEKINNFLNEYELI
ncbi:MAG: WbqC family protein [Ignavibacteria bacterium]|nr:WbqC family protein [Ignavibacteria bacterium]